MKIKKIGLLFFAFLLISLVSAINIEVEKKAINDVIIKELNNNATFEFTIKNLGETDKFELYSLVGVDMSPKEAFTIAKGETKKVNVEVNAAEIIKRNSGYFTFVYKIKGSSMDLQEERLTDKLTIKIVDLKDVFELSADSINPESDKAKVYMQNKENFDFSKIEAEFSSVFFNFKESFSLNGLEKKSFTTSLDKEKYKTLMAGSYLLDAKIQINGAEAKLESTIKFLEKSGLSVEEIKEGFVVARYEIEKKNEGNLITVAEISMSKNIISRLFTTFNLNPSETERKGAAVSYSWQKELRPGESLKVVARTNWYIPLIIIIAIAIIIILFQIYLTSDVILKKRINFVKTKGGEFALKVSINVRARRFAEKIDVVDKLPPIVKLYERYGTIAPDRIDEKNRRVEWNIESLNKDEEVVFSYIIYSKIGIVGKFELPSARAVYEREGKVKETASNKVFFLNEPKNRKSD